MGAGTSSTILESHVGKLESPVGKGLPAGKKEKYDPKEKKKRKIIGDCPVTNVIIQGKAVQAMLDTGSQITTITDEWARENLRNIEEEESFFKIKAVNGVEVPYSSLCVLDMELFGTKLTEVPVFITALPTDPFMQARKRETPVLVGMNVLETVFEKAEEMPESLNFLTKKIKKEKESSKRIGRTATLEHIPAYSVATIRITSAEGLKGNVLATPLTQPLPRGLIGVPTLVDERQGQRYIRIANLSAEDQLLSAKLPVALLERVDVETKQIPVELQVNEIVIGSASTQKEQENEKKNNTAFPEFDFEGIHEEEKKKTPTIA